MSGPRANAIRAIAPTPTAPPEPDPLEGMIFTDAGAEMAVEALNAVRLALLRSAALIRSQQATIERQRAEAANRVEPVWMTVANAARYLGVDERQVRRYIEAGQLRPGLLPTVGGGDDRMMLRRAEVEALVREG